jgi:ABC-type branched-subunit amino acid transport system ATPase component
MNIIDLQSLYKTIDGSIILDSLSLSFPEGKISSIIGPNGAGKTTIFDAISGFINIDSGNIIFKGKSIKNLPVHKIARLGISRSFQDVKVLPEFKVVDNIVIALNSKHYSNIFHTFFYDKNMKNQKVLLDKANEILDLVGLYEKKDFLSQELSYGQKKLLEIARIIALNPSILLLDEPTSGLSNQKIDKLAVIIQNLCAQGKTIAIIEHNLEFTINISDQVIVIENGRNIAVGKPKQIIEELYVSNTYFR